MKFKDAFARWAKKAAGQDTPPFTDEEKDTVTQDLNDFIGHMDMSVNEMRFKDLVVRAKTKSPNEQEITVQIVFTKSGTGGLIMNGVD